MRNRRCIMIVRFVLCGLAAVMLLSHSAHASECAHAGALGTARQLKIRTDVTPGIGHGFPALGLAQGEVILTFDDGPLPDTTPRILDILARECIQATFFMIGKRAEAHPDIVARVRAAGHSIGSHSYTHRNLARLPYEEATTDIQQGYEAVETAEFGSNTDRPRLFRFPDYKSTPDLVDFVRQRHGTITDVNMSPADWRGQPADVTMQRVKLLFDRQGKGILGLHDSQKNTVELLPMIIAELKARHMHVVHLTVE
jgi:peptidoglycan/xylan/chitin deacetylase (PgdA/CDA1 family)